MYRTEASHSPLRRMLDAAELQGIVIRAVMMREIHTRYGRENLGFVWLIFEPLFFCLGVMAVWSVIHGRFSHGLPILAFVITGYMPLTLWRHTTARAVQCFRANAALLYHRQVKMMDLLIARVLLEFYGVMIAYLVIAFIFTSLELYEMPRDWAMFYIGWFQMLAFSTATALIIGSLTEMYEWSEKLIGPFMYFMLPICGAFYMIEWLPGVARKYVEWLPTVQAFEMIREGQFAGSVNTHYDIGYATFFNAALIAAGILLCRSVHRHMVIE